ncbi:RNA polymerase sigma factor [Rubinisphaera margarita]|uniref:RNA polymerase sigma factor n=1 Tax=Rubinisphaera margarita TaxID=2909586 RepID=UPI001EE8A709|nr:sigma-70 family RNA polymerase sigma factor [Rubinisphaera margarita]MCG6155910.1 sigma-70 family RNA polymerase sigma factor [Rubinisphaera margarita]
MNNSDFIQALKNREQEAVHYLSDSFLPAVWRLAYLQSNGNSHLAEDVASDAVMELVKAVEGGTEIENPVAWMRTVVRNKVADHMRAAKRVRHLMDKVQHESPCVSEPEGEQMQLQLERQSEVRQAMSRLPEHYQLALEWKYIDHKSLDEIAERLGSSRKSVESILFRARRDLRDAVQGLEKQQEQEVVRRKVAGEDGESPGESPCMLDEEHAGESYRERPSCEEAEVGPGK